MLTELEQMIENDPESLEEDFVEEQESAGYHDPPQRRAFAGHFNHLLMWSILTEGTNTQEPTGAVRNTIYLIP
jgi:superoxide dismutase